MKSIKETWREHWMVDLTFLIVRRDLLVSARTANIYAEVHHKYVYGGHVAAYMRTLMEDEPERYQTHFADIIKKGIQPDGLEEIYKNIHTAIRADPTPKISEKQPPKKTRYNLKKLTYEERKAKLIERLNALNSAAGIDEDDE